MKDDDDDSGASSSGPASVSSYGNPRASRNMAEKQRRDNLNTQIATMASLVPTVAHGGSRKKDKISVLRLTAAYLRFAYTVGLPTGQFLPRRFNAFDLENNLVETLVGGAGFLLMITTTGKIIYISKHVEQHLGYDQADLIGDTLYNYVYREDHDELARGLTPGCTIVEVQNGANNNASDSLEESSNSSDEGSGRIEYSNFKDRRTSFNVRMAQRTNSRRESVQYEYLQISGLLRLARECQIKHKNKKHFTGTSNDIVFIGSARLLKKRTITELSLLEANRNEYFTRHVLDGRIIFCDHRISVIAGYMSEEVSGTSAFKFMHRDDVRWTMVALRDMYDHGKNYGSSCYRLITKTGEFIYLKTYGYLEYDEVTHTFTSFICINTLTSEEEGEELIAEMKKRFSATIVDGCMAGKIIQDDGFESESECSSTSHGIAILDEASQLEDALAQLLGDLPTPLIEERPPPMPLPNAQLVKAAMYSQSLPPASIQASRIGITDITENSYAYGKGKGGKNGKGKQPPKDAQTSGKSIKKYGEKKMPELDEPSSPTVIPASRPTVPIAEKVMPSVNENDQLEPDIRVAATIEIPPLPTSECGSSLTVPSSFDMKSVIVTYNEVSPIKANDDLMPLKPESQPQQQTNLKRSCDHLEKSNNMKRRPGNNGENVDLVNVSDNVLLENEEYPVYVPLQPMTLNTDLQEVPSDFKQLDTISMSIPMTEDQFIDFQDLPDDQLLNSSIESNPEIIKLFSNLPPTINLDGTLEDPNAHQYPTSDQGAVVENEVRRAHLQLADSVSSCESQFSDVEESNIQNPCDIFTQNDHKIQKQQIARLQLNVQHDIGV